MRVSVALPSGDIVCYCTDELGLQTIEQLQRYISDDQGFPVDRQILRTAHTMKTIDDINCSINDFHKQANFKGDEIRLDLLVDLSGAANSNCNVGDFEPAVKILCLQCSCTGEWKHNQLCCCKCKCSIQ